MAAWGTAAGDLAFIDPPPARSLEQAQALLVDLHAIDPDANDPEAIDRGKGSITPLGRSMLGLPVHPRLARMVAIEQSTLACIVASVVDERDVFRGRPDDLPADLSLRVGVIAGSASHDAADRGAVFRVRDRAADLARRAGIRFDLDSVDVDRTGATLLLAYPDRIAGRRRPGQFQLRSGEAAWLPDDDPLGAEAFVVAADLDGRGTRSRIRLAAAVDAVDVVTGFGSDIVEQRSLVWDVDRGDLVERVERRLGAIQLGRTEGRAAPGAETTAALMDHLRRSDLALLPWNAASRALRERVEYLHRVLGEPWPDWSMPTLARTVDEWLAPYTPGITGRADLDRVDLAMVLRSQLPWPAGAELDEFAPAALELPTGRSVPIDYSADAPDRGGSRAGPVRSPGASARRWTSDRVAPALPRRPADPGDRRPPRVLGRVVGGGPQGDGRPLPETPVAGRPGDRHPEATPRPLI